MASVVLSPKLDLAYEPPFGPPWYHTKVRWCEIQEVEM